MILREFFYFDRETGETEEDPSYDPRHDTGILNKEHDTRKTRLTLKQLNTLRKISDKHVKEQEVELEFIARMYAQPTEPTM